MSNVKWMAVVSAIGVGVWAGGSVGSERERPQVLPPAVEAPAASQAGAGAPEPAPSAGEPAAAKGEAQEAVRFEDRVADFVQGYYLSGETKSDVELAQLYAASVDYFDKRRWSKAQVLADKRAYFAKWPQRKYALIRDTLKVARRPGAARVYDVAFEYTFDVGSPRRVSRGRGVAELTMDLSSDGGRITREGGRVLARW